MTWRWPCSAQVLQAILGEAANMVWRFQQALGPQVGAPCPAAGGTAGWSADAALHGACGQQQPPCKLASCPVPPGPALWSVQAATGGLLLPP